MMLPTRLRVSLGRTAPSETLRPLKTWVIPVLIVALVVLAAFAIADSGETPLFLVVALAVVALAAILGSMTGLRWLSPKVVNVERSEGPLVMTPPAALQILVNLMAGLALLSVVVLWVQPDQWADAPFYTRGVILGGPVVGALMTGQTLLSLRRPAGLGLDDYGLRGVRGGPHVALKWSQLEDIRVIEVKKTRTLVLVTVDGPVQVKEGTLSGDVYAVATVVAYYLHHPDERARLSSGVDAVRHVEAEVLAGQFAAL
ncbi:hypothetical protein [Demequina oxidasica]|uniref:hypothetical protein n=1 Tax=Demequina oxidasica TaxID=676199 RepID=UPI0007851C4A|nr:hypothetical protein [Demequina oxidasica]